MLRVIPFVSGRPSLIVVHPETSLGFSGLHALADGLRSGRWRSHLGMRGILFALWKRHRQLRAGVHIAKENIRNRVRSFAPGVPRFHDAGSKEIGRAHV